LNDGVKGFLPGDDWGERRVVYDGAFLSVASGSPEYILAMKLLASRVGRDEADVLLLYDLCGFTTADEGLEVVARYFPAARIEPKVACFVDDLLARRDSNV
jgi:hypothetical protein